MMALALKGLGVEGKSSKDKSRTKSERMSKKMAKEDQMYRRKLSLSKVKVASSPTNSTPSSSPSSSNTSSLAADIDAQGSIISEKPVLILPGITSQSKPPVPNSPAVASSSSSAASSSSSSAVHPLSSLPQMSLARRNSRIQLTPTNSINFGGSPRVRAVASPLTRARRGSIGSTSSSSPSLRPAGRTQIKFSIQFLRMHNERKQRRAEEQERKKAKDELQHKVLGNINLLEQRLAELRKMKEECKPGNVNEEQRIQAAQTILQQLEQVQCPTVSATTKSKNNRMEEEQARRLKKKMAADLIQETAGASMIRDQEAYAQLERQEQTIERELTKLRAQCVEANSRDAIMREEKLRREERLRLKSLERRNSSSCSPRLRFANKPLPPVRKGLFVKAAEAAKIAAQEQQTPVALTRMGRLAAEKARREATRDQAVPV